MIESPIRRMKRQTTTEDYLKRTPFSLSNPPCVENILLFIMMMIIRRLYSTVCGSMLEGLLLRLLLPQLSEKGKKEKEPNLQRENNFFFFLFFSDVYVKMMKVRLIHYECCQMSNLFHIFSLISRPRSRIYTFRSCRNNKSKTPWNWVAQWISGRPFFFGSPLRAVTKFVSTSRE